MNVTLSEHYVDYFQKISKAIEDKEHYPYLSEAMQIATETDSVTKEQFVKDLVELLVEKRERGVFNTTIEIGKEPIPEWITNILESREEQKDTPLSDTGYDILTLTSFVHQSYIDDNILEFRDSLEREITEEMNSYNSSEYADFLCDNPQEIFSELEDLNIAYIDIDVIEERRTYDVNVLMVTPEEWNSDLSATAEFLDIFFDCVEKGSELKTEDIPSVKKVEETYLGKLLHQQGYTFADLVKNTNDNETYSFEKDSPFLRTFREELEEVGRGSTGVLAICTSMSSDQIYDFFKNPNNICGFEKQTMLGFFDPQNGGGSLMGIELDKTLVFPTKDGTILIEDSHKKRHHFHTVNSVYGLCSSAFDREMRVLPPGFTFVENNHKKRQKISCRMG